jgi:hypothetical protein
VIDCVIKNQCVKVVVCVSNVLELKRVLAMFRVAVCVSNVLELLSVLAMC